jgi:hypothetical protein
MCLVSVKAPRYKSKLSACKEIGREIRAGDLCLQYGSRGCKSVTSDKAKHNIDRITTRTLRQQPCDLMGIWKDDVNLRSIRLNHAIELLHNLTEWRLAIKLKVSWLQVLEYPRRIIFP